jgi:hypothetical protein
MNGIIGKFFESDFAKDWKQNRREQWNNPSWWNLMAVWPLPFILAFCLYQSHLDRQIAVRQQVVEAHIVTHDPPNHDRYGYEFSLAGKTYMGWVYPNSVDSYSIGQNIAIYYDPIDPTKNSGSDFAHVSANDLFFVPFCLAALISLPVFIDVRRRNWRRKAVQNATATTNLNNC